MKTEAIYLEDAYVKKWDARVIDVSGEDEKSGRLIQLDRTAFYPNGGGQPFDTGTIIRKSDGSRFNVIYTGKFGSSISHEIDAPGLEKGDLVECEIDWGRRYSHMKMHTAAHVLSELLFRDTNALITGNQIGEDKTRIDFDLENYDRGKIFGYVDEANKILEGDLKIRAEFLPREEALKIPQVSKLAKGISESLDTIRIVSIGDFDIQADGGTHVNSTREIGKIKLLKIDNRGKNNRRIYFELE